MSDRQLVVFWASGTASALDQSSVAAGRDVGSSGVFDRRVNGRTLTFEPGADATFRDRETRSTWNLRELATDGPLMGAHLAALPSGDYFWFAWAVFRPETRVRR